MRNKFLRMQKKNQLHCSTLRGLPKKRGLSQRLSLTPRPAQDSSTRTPKCKAEIKRNPNFGAFLYVAYWLGLRIWVIGEVRYNHFECLISFIWALGWFPKLHKLMKSFKLWQFWSSGLLGGKFWKFWSWYSRLLSWQGCWICSTASGGIVGAWKTRLS